MKNRLSLKDRILRYLRSNEGIWVNGGTIERLTLDAGYKASNGSRRCRELAEEGLIQAEEKTINGTRSVWYMAKARSIMITKAEDGRILATEKVW